MSWERDPLKLSKWGREHRNCSVVNRLSINWGNMGSTESLGSEQEALTRPVMLLPRGDLSGIQWAKQSCKGCNTPLRSLLNNEPQWLVCNESTQSWVLEKTPM